MILHLCGDDKFFNNIKKAYDNNFSSENEYIVISGKKHNKYIFDQNVPYLNYIQMILLRFKKYIDRSDVVISHGLDNSRLLILLYAKIKGKIAVWHGFGAEYYGIYLNHIDLYDEKTKYIIRKINKYDKTMILLKYIKYDAILRYLKKLAIDKIDYFYPVIPNEYKMIKARYPGFKPKYIDLGFKKYIDFGDNAITQKKYILLGNSATYENNHIDIIEIIKNSDLNSYRIIVPLSYPRSYRNNEYKKYLKKTIKLNKCHIEYLEDFLQIDEYRNILRKCISAIMGHHRQQAAGNVYSLLFYGARVFLYEDNPLYQYLKENCVYVSTIEELKHNTALLTIGLSSYEKKANMQFVVRQYNGSKNDFELMNRLNKKA